MDTQTGGQKFSRQKFVAVIVTLLGGVVSVIIGLPAMGYLISPALKKNPTDAWVPLGPIDTLVEGIPVLFSFTRTKQIGWEATASSYGIYAVRKKESDLDVFSNVCTHLSCRVSWREDLDHFFCPCHDGHYAKDGTVLAGPPPRPLDRFEYRVEDGILYIHIVEG